jgi:hypothetical protein
LARAKEIFEKWDTVLRSQISNWLLFSCR